VADAVARGKGPVRPDPADAAVVLALFARPWSLAGATGEGLLDLAPLTGDDVETLVGDLCAVASVRKTLEAGRDVTAGALARLERAAVAVLGRLGRVGTAAPTRPTDGDGHG
jgi:hypothetical protein